MKLDFSHKVYLHFTNTTIQDIERVFHHQSIEYYEDENSKIFVKIKQLPVVGKSHKLKLDNERYIPLSTGGKLYAYVINKDNFKYIKVGLSPNGTVEYINGSKKVLLSNNFNELLYVTHDLLVKIDEQTLTFNKCFLIFSDKMIDDKYHNEIIPIIRPFERCSLFISFDLELSKRLKEND